MVSCLMYGLSLQLHETLALSHLYIYHPYFLFLYTYYNLFISFTCSHIKYNRFVHFISLRKYNLFISYNSLYINIITHDRLQIIFQQCIINFLHTSAIRNFKLIIAFVLDVFHMASDSGADSCRNLSSRNTYEMISHACAWNELGISGGTAIIILIALYFVIKWAVKNGIKEAYSAITGKKTDEDIQNEKELKELGLDSEDQ